MGAERLLRRRFGPPCLLLLLLLFVTAQLLLLDGNTSLARLVRNKISALTRTPSKPKPKGPLHVLLVSYPRTGSSFLGDLLQSLPDTFYHFEPLHYVGNTVVTNTTLGPAMQLLHHLFSCNVTQLPRFLQWQKVHKAYMKLKRSTAYWKACSTNNSCYSASYMDTFCRNRSAVIVKTIRLTLHDAEALFRFYPDLNLKIVYLMRDPRGTMTSRTKKPISAWCQQDSSCMSADKFCSLLSRDLNATCSLMASRPEDFTVVRYEDLSLYPFQTATKILKFLGVTTMMPASVEAFLRTHTTFSGRPPRVWNGVAYSYATFRNSSVTATRWRQDVSFERLQEWQRDCAAVLPRVGYHTYVSVGALRSNLNLDANLSESLAATCSLK